MVVGRRRVAAASVATAYALHVYVLPTPFSTAPNRPSLLFRLIPIAQKFVCTRVADTFRGCWYCAPSSRFSRPFRSTRTGSLDSLSPRPLHPPPGYTYTFRIHTLSLLATNETGKRRETPGSAEKRRETTRRAAPRSTALSPSYSGLSPSVHPLLTFFFFRSDFLPLSLIVLACLATLHFRIETVCIVLRSVSKLRENDRFSSSVSLVVFHPCPFIPRFLCQTCIKISSRHTWNIYIATISKLKK